MKNYFILTISLFIISCSGPETDSKEVDSSIRVDLDSNYDAQSRGTTILYAMSEMEDSLRSKIIFPDLSEISDTSFTQIYFTGNNHAAIENGIMVLVGNYTSESPLLWVDYNNDLDFSDEGKPLSFSEAFIDISIPNNDQPELVYTLRFHKLDSVRKAEIKPMLEQFIIKGEPYSDFFFDESRNIKVGDFMYKGDSLRIGVVDYNINGSYTDLGTDRIVIGTYGGSITGTEESAGAIILDSTNYFQGESYAFEVKEIADDGTSILIKPTLASNVEHRIKEGESIPDYTFELLSGEKTSVHKYLNTDKHLYLSFWANWCVGCHQEVEDLKRIYSDHSDKFTLIGLNYNEDAGKVKSFLDKYSIKWLNGFSTAEINEGLLIQGMPRNILIDPSGKIVEMNIHPANLLERVDEF